MPLAIKDTNHAEVSDFLFAFAKMLLGGRRVPCMAAAISATTFYRTTMADTKTIAATALRSARPAGRSSISVPKTFQSAANDGQRWRWCLQKAGEIDPEQRDWARLSSPGSGKPIRHGDDAERTYARPVADAPSKAETMPPRRALGEDETIARLATGVQRLKLPDEFNFITIYRQIVDGDGQRPSQRPRRYATTAHST